MPCYILKAGDTDKVKIGWSDDDVEGRRAALQTAHWEDLTTVRVIDGGPWTERAMHKRFAASRIKREWFVFHPDMMTFCPSPDAVKQNTNRDAVLRICSTFGGQTALSRLLGLSQGTVSEWVGSGFVPYRRIPEVISAASRLDPPRKLQPNDFFVATIAELRVPA